MKTEAEIRAKLEELNRDKLFFKGWGKRQLTPIIDGKLKLLEWVLE